MGIFSKLIGKKTVFGRRRRSSSVGKLSVCMLTVGVSVLISGPLTAAAQENEPEENAAGSYIVLEEITTEHGVIEQALPGMDILMMTEDDREDLRRLEEHLPEIRTMSEGMDYAPGELVFLADSIQQAQAVADSYGALLKSCEYGVGVLELQAEMSVEEAVSAAISSYSAGGETFLPPAWPNYYYYADPEIQDTVPEPEGSFEAYFYDPFLNAKSLYYQWQHAMVGSAYAWRAGYKGQGVTVAVLDTGSNNHNDLPVKAQYDMTGSSTGAEDKHGHGTHVAGLIAARLSNGLGGSGIAPEADIIGVKVLKDSGSGTTSDIMRGINLAVKNGADIINMSLGGGGYSSAYEKVVDSAMNSGVAVFAAAGNSYSETKHYPAGFASAIAIGAVMQNGGRTVFSNYGKFVDFSAPGYNLYSTHMGGTGYISMSGTSQATPVVAGEAAVILSADSSIMGKTGKARVEALVKKMKSGVIKSGGGASPIVSLPKVLKLSTSSGKPSAPVITKGGKVKNSYALVELKDESGQNDIYYTVDGSNVVYRDGILYNGMYYDGVPIRLEGMPKVTVKAIAVNDFGVVSGQSTQTFMLEPDIQFIEIDGPATVAVNSSVQLDASIEPSYSKSRLTWTSSDNSVAVVSNGKVTGKKTGMAVIKVKAMDNTGEEAGFTVYVIEKAPLKSMNFADETGKKINSLNVYAGLGNTLNLRNLLVFDMQDGEDEVNVPVRWTSSNNSAAYVDGSGILYPKSAGKMRITAKAADGSGKTAVLNINVKQLVENFSISGSSFLAIGKKGKYTLSVHPSNADTSDVIWQIKDMYGETPNGITVDSKGQVSVASTAQKGEYILTAEVNAGMPQEFRITEEFAINIIDSVIADIKIKDANGSNVGKASIFRTAGTYNSSTYMMFYPEIKATGNDRPRFSVTSDKPGIANVYVDEVTNEIEVYASGTAVGTAKITVKALDGGGKSASFNVSVLNPPSKLTISYPASSAGYICTGKTLKLDAVFETEHGTYSSKKVKWTIPSGSDIATISQAGVLKALKPGATVMVRAEALDGSGAYATKTVTIVKPIKTIAVSGVGKKSPIRVSAGYSMTYNLKFNNSTSTSGLYGVVDVSLSNQDVAAVTQAGNKPGVINIVGNKKGTCTMTIKALDGSGAKVSYKVTVK